MTSPTKSTLLFNISPDRVKDFGISSLSELIITNHTKRSVFGKHSPNHHTADELREIEAKRSAELRGEDSVLLYGKPVRVDPHELEVNSSMIAHVTNAKTPIKQHKDRTNVLSRISGTCLTRPA